MGRCSAALLTCEVGVGHVRGQAQRRDGARALTLRKAACGAHAELWAAEVRSWAACFRARGRELRCSLDAVQPTAKSAPDRMLAVEQLGLWARRADGQMWS